jgi:shikimate 5-dehydrogenase
MSGWFHRRACLAGWPAEHSRSPIIGYYWLKTYGLKGACERGAVPSGEVSRFAATIGAERSQGANVPIWLATTLGRKYAAAPRTPIRTSLRAADLPWNAMSLGRLGQRPLELDVGLLKPRSIAKTLDYVPLRSAFIERTATREHRVVIGLGRLLPRAAPEFGRWFGVRPGVSPRLRAVGEADVRAGKVPAE